MLMLRCTSHVTPLTGSVSMNRMIASLLGGSTYCPSGLLMSEQIWGCKEWERKGVSARTYLVNQHFWRLPMTQILRLGRIARQGQASYKLHVGPV